MKILISHENHHFHEIDDFMKITIVHGIYLGSAFLREITSATPNKRFAGAAFRAWGEESKFHLQPAI